LEQERGRGNLSKEGGLCLDIFTEAHVVPSYMPLLIGTSAHLVRRASLKN